MGNSTFAKFKELIKDMNKKELEDVQYQIKTGIFQQKGLVAAGFRPKFTLKNSRKMNAIIETKLRYMQ